MCVDSEKGALKKAQDEHKALYDLHNDGGLSNQPCNGLPPITTPMSSARLIDPRASLHKTSHRQGPSSTIESAALAQNAHFRPA